MSSENRERSREAADQALHAIGLLFQLSDVLEIRALHVGRTTESSGVTCSGYFNFESEKAIRAAIQKLDGRSEGIYVVLNPFNPVLLSRANNRLQAKPKHTTSDSDIVQRRWLYIDADPVRPAGISASEEEHQAAIRRAAEIREFLQSLGWPEPIFADSGNGAHLLYQLPELHLVRAGELVKACLKALASRFSDPLVTVDESTASAARLCKLYGTMARKGDSTPSRPHRRSGIIEEPERIEAVPFELLELLAGDIEDSSRSAGGRADTMPPSGPFRIEEWLRNTGLELVKGPEPYDGGRKWTLQTCPFNPEHVKPVIIELASGALCYKCLHKSCAQYDWKAFRKLVEPDHYDQPSGNRGNDGAPQFIRRSSDTRVITDLSQIPSVWNLEANLEWCVEGMIAQGSVTLISAESGTGKTWIAYYIASCVAHGAPAIGRRVNQKKVLYLDGENPLYVVKQRLFDLGITATSELTIWGGWNPDPPPGPDHPLVIDFARQYKGLIVYDSLIEFHPGSEQSSTETRAFMRQFRALANLGASVIVLHNAGKAESSKLYRGSSDIKAAVDTAYQLRGTDGQSERLGALHMSCFKGRLVPGQSFGLEFRPKQGFVSCEAPQVCGVQEIVSEILRAASGSNQKQIIAKAREKGCTKRQVEACLQNGPWSAMRGPNNSILYSLPDQPR